MQTGLQAQQFVLHLGADQRIECAERLIHDQHVGLGRQRTCQTYPLAHSTAQGVGVMRRPRGQAHHIQNLARLLVTLAQRQSAQFQPEGDVFDDALVWQKSEILEHHRDPMAADVAHLFRTAMDDILAIQQNLPGLRLQYSVHATRQRRFARSRQSHNDGNGSLGHGQRHVIDAQNVIGFGQQRSLGRPVLQPFHRPFRVGPENLEQISDFDSVRQIQCILVR